jgi:hypothetical protein
MKPRLKIWIISIIVIMLSTINFYILFFPRIDSLNYILVTEFTLLPMIISLLLEEDIKAVYKISGKSAGALIGLVTGFLTNTMSAISGFIYVCNNTMRNISSQKTIVIMVTIIGLIITWILFNAISSFFGWFGIVIKDLLTRKTFSLEAIRGWLRISKR